MAFCLSGSLAEAGSGILSVTGMTCSGLVPQVICGTILFTSTVTSASKAASRSLASERQSARAWSHCAPLGA